MSDLSNLTLKRVAPVHKRRPSVTTKPRFQPPVGASASPGKAQTGTEWTPHFDEASGEVYYFNAATKESRWENPYSADIDLNDVGAQGWKMYHDKASGQYYYQNDATGVSQWENPFETKSTKQADIVDTSDLPKWSR